MLLKRVQASEQRYIHCHYVTDDAGSTALDDTRISPQVEHGISRLRCMAAEVLRASQHVMMHLARSQRAIYEYEMSQVRWPWCWMRYVRALDTSIIFFLPSRPATSRQAVG